VQHEERQERRVERALEVCLEQAERDGITAMIGNLPKKGHAADQARTKKWGL